MRILPWNLSTDPTTLQPEDFEKDLTLLGATGVEDLLQDNVQDCIKDFRDAGINVWMLTGDKGATAKEIGISCGLITPPPVHGDERHDARMVTVPSAAALDPFQHHTFEFPEFFQDHAELFAQIKLANVEGAKFK